MTLAVSIVSVITIFTSFVLYLGPAPAVLTIYRARSTGVTPLVPLVAMFLSAWIWSAYGLLQNDIFPVMVTNATGVVLAAIYVGVYYYFTTDKPYAHKVFAGFGAIFVIVTLYGILGRLGYTNQSHEAVAKVMGILANIFVFVFFAAPFENIRQVFRHRSGVFLPIMIVLATVINGSAWVVYGVLVGDMVVTIPNVGAVTIGGIQVAVYLYFHPSTHPYHPPATATGDPKDLEAASAPVTSPSFVALQSPAMPAQA